jgi:hypothetical protein
MSLGWYYILDTLMCSHITEVFQDRFHCECTLYICSSFVHYETMSTFLFQSQRNWLSHHVLQTYMNMEKLFPKNTLRLKRRILSWILMILVINSITLTSNHKKIPFIHLKTLTTVTISCKLLQYMNETNIGTFQCQANI